MPYGDGTGPMGLGPMSGRRAGYCGGFHMPGFMNNIVPRRGYNYGSMHGYWRGYWHHGPIFADSDTYPIRREFTKDEQKKILEEELKDLEMEKENILKRLKELE